MLRFLRNVMGGKRLGASGYFTMGPAEGDPDVLLDSGAINKVHYNLMLERDEQNKEKKARDNAATKKTARMKAGELRKTLNDKDDEINNKESMHEDEMVAIMNLADAKNKDGSWGPDFQIRCKNFGFSPRKCFCTGAYNNILGAACCKTCARGQVCKHNHHQNKNISGVQLGKRKIDEIKHQHSDLVSKACGLSPWKPSPPKGDQDLQLREINKSPGINMLTGRWDGPPPALQSPIAQPHSGWNKPLPSFPTKITPARSSRPDNKPRAATDQSSMSSRERILMNRLQDMHEANKDKVIIKISWKTMQRMITSGQNQAVMVMETAPHSTP